jgi:hypothetical protein
MAGFAAMADGGRAGNGKTFLPEREEEDMT